MPYKQSAEYRRRRREQLAQTGLCKTCAQRPPIAGQTACVPCRQRDKSIQAIAHARFKKTIFEYYGAICNCCGETEPTFLTIDHINNDGNVQRMQIKTGGTNFYRTVAKRIEANDAPTDLQILCRNCNWGKHVNHGVCPHLAKYIDKG